MDRRTFLQSSAAVGLSAAAGLTLAGVAPDPPRKALRAGLIGCGWYGRVGLRHLMQHGGVEVVSVCDVDQKFLAETADEVMEEQGGDERPATFTDFRDMLRPRDLDVVLVGSPDHWHPLHAIAAMHAGADVWVEKPVGHTFLEGRAMLDTARKLQRIVQVDTQRRSTPHFVQARDFIHEGRLGHIGVVKAYCYMNMLRDDNPPDTEPPTGFDYDLWTGPAPLRPYNKLVHPRTWRWFREYGNGILGDMGIHMLDVMRWVMGVRYPRRVSSTGGTFVLKGGKANVTDTQTVTYDYGDFTAVWEHRMFVREDDPRFGWGVLFVGETGTVRVTPEGWRFEPTGGRGKPVSVAAVKEPDPDGQQDPNVRVGSRAHMANFLECVKSRRPPVADIEEGHVSTALCTLGTVAQTLGRTITWDAETERAVGDEEANALLKREYRKPWIYTTT
jgi:predicted dehydrogenase